MKRAGTDKLREVFQKYASVQKNGEHYMTSEDFVRKFLGLFVETAFNDVSMGISIAKPGVTDSDVHYWVIARLFTVAQCDKQTAEAATTRVT